MAELKFKSTAEIKVPGKIVEQVIGQEEAVEVIKKAAEQRRHVLLIGEPGTGKSMLGLALAELLPMEKLVDVIAFPNPNDENMPLVRTLPAGQGRDLVAKARIQGMNMFKNQNIIMFIIFLFVVGSIRSFVAITIFSLLRISLTKSLPTSILKVWSLPPTSPSTSIATESYPCIIG